MAQNFSYRQMFWVPLCFLQAPLSSPLNYDCLTAGCRKRVYVNNMLKFIFSLFFWGCNLQRNFHFLHFIQNNHIIWDKFNCTSLRFDWLCLRNRTLSSVSARVSCLGQVRSCQKLVQTALQNYRLLSISLDYNFV